MIVAACEHESCRKVGTDRKGNQRLRCNACGKYMLAETVKPIGDMRISMKDACAVLIQLVEGCSIRTTERITGIHRDTIDDLILVVGENCGRLMKEKIQSVEAKDVQLDEAWSFIGMKERTRIAKAHSADWGDSWTFIAFDRETKMVLTYAIGQRDMATSMRFLRQLDKATTGRFQLSTDGLSSYTLNVPFVLGSRVDFAQLIKSFASSQSTVRYSPAKITGCEKIERTGRPDFDRICTSHVERFNLTLRMSSRRHTRLTNGHSKSLKHHVAMQAILFAYYNFCRKHLTIKSTPAQAAGLTDSAWTIRRLLEEAAN